MMSVTGGRRGSGSHWPNDHITTLDSRQVYDDDRHLLVRERADFLTGLLWDFTDSISLLTTSSFGQLDPRHGNLIRQISLRNHATEERKPGFFLEQGQGRQGTVRAHPNAIHPTLFSTFIP